MEEAWELAALSDDNLSAESDSQSESSALIGAKSVITASFIAGIFAVVVALIERSSSPDKIGAETLDENEQHHSYHGQSKLTFKLINATSQTSPTTVVSSGDLLILDTKLDVSSDDTSKTFRLGNFYKSCDARVNCFTICSQVLWRDAEMIACEDLLFNGDFSRENSALEVGLFDFPNQDRDRYFLVTDGFSQSQAPAGFNQLSSLVPPLYFLAETKPHPSQIHVQQGVILDSFSEYPVEISGQNKTITVVPNVE